MMSYFPARDVEEPATKEFVRAENAGLRAEFAGLRADQARQTTRLVMWMIATQLATISAVVTLLG